MNSCPVGRGLAGPLAARVYDAGKEALTPRRASMQRIGVARFVELPMATAEDSIISKLEWYPLTNEASERQWDDVSRPIDLLGGKTSVATIFAGQPSWSE